MQKQNISLQNETQITSVIVKICVFGVYQQKPKNRGGRDFCQIVQEKATGKKQIVPKTFVTPSASRADEKIN